MSKGRRNPPRKPATKLPHLRKKLDRQKAQAARTKRR
jgi:hypothetical protein